MIYVRIDIKEFIKEAQFFQDNKVGAEITLYDTDYTSKMKIEEIQKIGEIIKEKNIEVVVHLPMYGTNMGLKESVISEYSLKVNKEALDMASVFGAKKAVFHNGFNPIDPPSVRKKWFDFFKPRFDKLLAHAEKLGIIIASENVWDFDDEYFSFLVDNYKSEFSKLCFDIGHSQIYFKGIDHEEYFKKYGSKITHIHVHDNHKTPEDEHLHIGEGTIDFEKYIALIREYTINPSYTLEVKFDEKVMNDVKYLTEKIK